MTIHHQAADVVIHHGDCLDVLRDIPDNSIDSVVCDPPYALSFMGSKWDSFGGRTMSDETRATQLSSGAGWTAKPYAASGKPAKPAPGEMRAFQQWCQLWAAETLRVLKPGGFLVSFGGPRTFHRLTCAIEDAGFEIRDSIGYGHSTPTLLSWNYGSGFPKSRNVSNDLAFIPPCTCGGESAERLHACQVCGGRRGVIPPGLGTALKPAWEPIVVARKPLDGTVAQSVLKWGTGALNVDACRIAGADAPEGRLRHGGGSAVSGSMSGPLNPDVRPPSPAGRWPANVVLDEDQAAALDKMSGKLHAPGSNGGSKNSAVYGIDVTAEQTPTYSDSGGASRFFLTAASDPLPIEDLEERFMYTAKAPKSERPSYERPVSPDGEGVIPSSGGLVAHPT